MKLLRIVLTTLALAALALLLVNCEQNSSTGPGGGVPVYSIDTVMVAAENQYLFSFAGSSVSTTITATVQDSMGTALQGISVYFTVSPSNFGTIATTQSVTDSLGQISVIFNSAPGVTGSAIITATVSSGSVNKSGQIPLTVSALTNIPRNITLSLTRETVYINNMIEDTLRAVVRVFDSLNVGVPNQQVIISTTKGVVSFTGLTDNSGTTVTTITTNQDTGMGIVTAKVNVLLPDSGASIQNFWPGISVQKILIPGLGFTQGQDPTQQPSLISAYQISDSDTFWIYDISVQVADVAVSAYPSVLTVAYDTTKTATITAIVRDGNNVGIPNVPVSFWTNRGLLSSGLSYTESNGMTTINYTTLANDYGISIIRAAVGNVNDSCTINISPTPMLNGLLTLYSSTDTVYADGGITFALMTALLKDADNQVIRDAPIIFTSNQGTIASPMMSDSTGQARSNFLGMMIPSPDSIPARIIAKYPPLNLADTVYVFISPARVVDRIVLITGSTYLTANNVDSTLVNATVYLEGNDFAPPGTEVNFFVIGNHGSHFPGSLFLVGYNGTASTHLIAGQVTGTDTVFAMCGDSLSNFVPITLRAGPASIIDVYPDTTILQVNSPITATITCELRDSLDNLVGNNFPISFTTSLGSITPTSAPTVNGIAIAHLQASTIAGGAQIKVTHGALMDSTMVTFIATGPATISLSADTARINQQGGGGQTFARISAQVRDASGNLITTPRWVTFEILGWEEPPVGPNINNMGQRDSSLTNGGIAEVVLNSGNTSGPVQIKASTTNPNPPYNVIQAQQSLVTITSGAPARIEIMAMSDPRDGGGDIIEVEVSAYVEDSTNNPVPNGTSVFFYLEPEGIGEIVGAGTTGNLNWNSQSFPGRCFTTLTYHSDETFLNVLLNAFCVAGQDTIIDTTTFAMPLWQGEVVLTIDPEAWFFEYPPYQYPANSPARMLCTATLKDGHHTPINGGTIVFYNNLGATFCPTNSPQGLPQYSSEITGPAGWVGNLPGVATLYLYVTEAVAYPDPTQITNTGQVHCNVSTDPDIDSGNKTVTFYHIP